MPNSQQQNHPMTSNVNSGEDKAIGGGGGGGGGSGSGTGDGVGEGEEQEESSSHPSSLDAVLTTFRKQWQRELETSPRRMKNTKDVMPSDENIGEEDRNLTKGEATVAAKEPDPPSDEAKARELFMKGVGEERAGKLYEAIQWYRRAMQLVPDIESRLYKAQHRHNAAEHDDEVESESEVEKESDEDEDEHMVDLKEEENLKDNDESIEDLTARLQKIFSRRHCICQTEEEQKGMHISALPMEILIYILRWVVSPHLDLRSLEACAAVSRGFFLCSRDPEIWRLACLRVWGSSCGLPGGAYPTWRDMFVLGRPRIRFEGCYVSKTTYVRPGENSFQDSCYRPWHLVVYFRYLRFFPGGTAVMLTTPDSPPGALASLRPFSTNPHLLRGHFRLLSSEGKVVLILYRKSSNPVQQQTTLNNQRFRSGRRKDTSSTDTAEQSFHLEFQILGHKRRNHVQLAWLAYTVVTRYRNGVTSSTAFDLSPADGRFPPFWFSRVRSYTSETDRPLQ